MTFDLLLTIKIKLRIKSEHAAFIGWDHILDVDVSILTTMLFKQFKSLLYQVTDILSLSLTVVNLISNVS